MSDFKLESYDYPLPEEAIAQRPPARRDQARLLVVERATGALRETLFDRLPDLLEPDGLLALNDTRVLPARLRLRKETGGALEILALEPVDTARFEALVRGRAAEGLRVRVNPGEEPAVEAVFEERRPEGAWLVAFTGLPAAKVLHRYGEIPLPPYIRRAVAPADRETYQTVYAASDGAVAAPTAGLHFTPELLARIRTGGTRPVFITLHVGWGTFRMIRATDIRAHCMEAERFEITPAAAEALNGARRAGRKITAVGTTVVRVLEGLDATGDFTPGAGRVNLFIHPGYRFRAVDRMVTNFHLPRTTTLLMTAAFCGRELLLSAYRRALEQGFRFGSYGDAMYIC